MDPHPPVNPFWLADLGAEPASGALVLHRSNRLEALADALADALRQPSAEPMRAVRVVVGSRGMELWLRHQIAQRTGICANVRFLLPQQALQEIVTALLGEDQPPAGPAWTADTLAWAVLACLPDLLDEPGFASLRAYLQDSAGCVDRRSQGLARQIAEVLDRILAYRPDWAVAWSSGRPVAELDLAADAWQPRLWQAIADVLGAEGHAPARMAAALQALPHAALDLEPLHVFGLSALPPAWLEFLAQAASLGRIDLYVPTPSPRWFADVRRQARPSTHDAQPLLAAFGRVGRDFQGTLEALPDELRDEPMADARFVPPIDEAIVAGDMTPDSPPTMLQWLQSDVYDVTDPRTLQREAAGGDADALQRWNARQLRDTDDSIRVHACHGPVRQVEVLRDTLLGLFADHPDLQPRDVIVMTPDVGTFAPLVEAVFAEGRSQAQDRAPRWGEAGAPQIPFEIADQSLRRVNPVADALLRVLDLAGSRFEASAVLDLIAVEPVRQRFDLAAEDLATVRSWVRDSGIRWGLDEADRQAHDQPADRANTWAFGLDRLALGVAMADDGGAPFAGILPFDDMEGSRVALLGRFLACTRTLFRTAADLRAARPMAEWHLALTAAIAALTQTTPKAAWLSRQVTDALRDQAQAAAVAGCTAPVTTTALSALLTGRFDIPAQEGGQRSGAVTVCSLQPRRNVPHRVVCLLGLDDGAFPRASRRLGFDLVAENRRPGDRDPREEDRYVFLEAVLAARGHLVILYDGRDPHTNEDVPPAVPVGELLDVLDRSFPVGPVRGRILVRNALQPFSEGPFLARVAGPDGRLRPSSFHAGMRQAAQLLRQERLAPTGLFAPGSPLSAEGLDAVTLDDLVRFLQHPTRFLLRKRLSLYLDERDDGIEDREPIELDKLAQWQVKEAILQAALAPGRPVRQRLHAGGTLPLGQPGELLLATATATIATLVDAVAPLRIGEAAAMTVDLLLGGIRLQGSVTAVYGDAMVAMRPGSVRPEDLLAAWTRLLAWQVACPEDRPRASFVGLKADGSKADVRQLALPDVAEPALWARERLTELVHIWLAGMQAPVLLFPRVSPKFASCLAGLAFADASEDVQRKAVAAALDEWTPGDFDLRPKDGSDLYHLAAHGESVPFIDGRDGAEGLVVAAFAELAVRVWQPLLAACGGKI